MGFEEFLEMLCLLADFLDLLKRDLLTEALAIALLSTKTLRVLRGASTILADEATFSTPW